jgi:hypothetical protein
MNDLDIFVEDPSVESYNELAKVLAVARNVKPIGSRRTCNPAPTDTDDDYLVLVSLLDCGDIYKWTPGGSAMADPRSNPSTAYGFSSFRMGEINIIVTTSELFFERFSEATDICRAWNLLEKTDRIAVHHAALYGRGVPQCLSAS